VQGSWVSTSSSSTTTTTTTTTTSARPRSTWYSFAVLVGAALEMLRFERVTAVDGTFGEPLGCGFDAPQPMTSAARRGATGPSARTSFSAV